MFDVRINSPPKAEEIKTVPDTVFFWTPSFALFESEKMNRMFSHPGFGNKSILIRAMRRSTVKDHEQRRTCISIRRHS